jgi:hypothetical protein
MATFDQAVEVGGGKESCCLQQSLDAGDGDADPIGSVVELVAQLVDRLLELEDG